MFEISAVEKGARKSNYNSEVILQHGYCLNYTAHSHTRKHSCADDDGDDNDSNDDGDVLQKLQH